MRGWHVVAARGKASVKVYWVHHLIYTKETGLLDKVKIGTKMAKQQNSIYQA